MPKHASALRQAACGAPRAARAENVGGAAAGLEAPPLAVFQRRCRTGHSLHFEVPKQVLAKTKMCKFFGMGVCTRGSACTYAHCQDELRSQPDLAKTEMCFEFVHTGKCSKRSTCRYAHGKAELRIPRSPAAVEQVSAAPPAARRRGLAAPAGPAGPAAPAAELDPRLLGEISEMQQETARLRAQLEELRRAAALQQAVCEEWTATAFSRQTTGGTEDSLESPPLCRGQAATGAALRTRGKADAGMFASTSTATTLVELEEPREVEQPVATQVVTCRTFFTLVPAQTRSLRRTSSCPPLGR